MNLIGLKNLGSPTWHRSALLAFATLWFWVGYSYAKREKLHAPSEGLVWTNQGITKSTKGKGTLGVRFDSTRGGKIISISHFKIIDREKGLVVFFEFLSKSMRKATKRKFGMPYGDTEFDGIDEIWPSMSEETINDLELFDHGELFSQKWGIADLGDDYINTHVRGVKLPYTFERQVRLISSTQIDLNYTIQNTGDHPINGLYAFHPLFTGMTGAIIEVPDDTPAWVSWSKQGFLGKRGTKTTWGALPSEGKLLKADSFTVGRDRYWKVFLKPAEPEVTLRYPNGKGLRMTWKDAHLPYLAVWVSEGMKGLHHIGLEPTNSRFEKHQQMLDNGEALTVPAGGNISWDITITLLP